jgi:hypothetical protein
MTQATDADVAIDPAEFLELDASTADAPVPLTRRLHRALHKLASAHMSVDTQGHCVASVIKYLGACMSDAQYRLFVQHAAQLTRRMLVLEVQRGGGAPASTTSVKPAFKLDEVDEVLIRLEQYRPISVRVVELCYFAGLTEAEAAAAMNLPLAETARELRLARAWIHSQLRANKHS